MKVSVLCRAHINCAGRATLPLHVLSLTPLSHAGLVSSPFLSLSFPLSCSSQPHSRCIPASLLFLEHSKQVPSELLHSLCHLPGKPFPQTLHDSLLSHLYSPLRSHLLREAFPDCTLHSSSSLLFMTYCHEFMMSCNHSCICLSVSLF